MPEPFLYALGQSGHVLDIPFREDNCTEGYYKIFKDLADPVESSCRGTRNPRPKNPATMLLRKTRGNKTSPQRLPNLCGFIANPPSRRRQTRFPVSDATSYNTARKKHR